MARLWLHPKLWLWKPLGFGYRNGYGQVEINYSFGPFTVIRGLPSGEPSK